MTGLYPGPLLVRKLVLPALLVFLLLPVRGWSQDVREYQIKAAFIYHFAQAVEWPDTSGPFRIGVLGSDPFGESLIALENRTIHGRTVEVVQLREPVFDELSLLFVSVSQLQDIPMITHLLEGRQILDHLRYAGLLR